MSGPKIDTLLDDINEVLGPRSSEGIYATEYFMDFALETGKTLVKAIQNEPRTPRESGVVYASELGTQCPRQFWYKINEPEAAEPLPASARIKFMYGHMIENLVLLLVKIAGHEVSNEQELVTTSMGGTTIRGRIDCTIDGVVVDVKSASDYAFEKMQGKVAWSDSFGYKEQLNFYDRNFDPRPAGRPLTSVIKSRFLVLNKTTGRLAWSYSEMITQDDLFKKADRLLSVAQSSPPPRLDTEPHAKGNVLGLACSYCAFKFHCWRDSNGGKGLRVFSYYKGPLFFTDVTGTDKAFLSKELFLGPVEVPNPVEEVVMMEGEGVGESKEQ